MVGKRQSEVTLHIGLARGPSFRAPGTAVRTPHGSVVVTAYHIVDEPMLRFRVSQDGPPTDAKVIRYNQKSDVAIVACGIPLAVTTVANSTSVGSIATTSFGAFKVLSLSGRHGGDEYFYSLRTCEGRGIQRGDSGAGLFNAAGELCGVAHGVWNDNGDMLSIRPEAIRAELDKLEPPSNMPDPSDVGPHMSYLKDKVDALSGQMESVGIVLSQIGAVLTKHTPWLTGGAIAGGLSFPLAVLWMLGRYLLKRRASSGAGYAHPPERGASLSRTLEAPDSPKSAGPSQNIYVPYPEWNKEAEAYKLAHEAFSTKHPELVWALKLIEALKVQYYSGLAEPKKVPSGE